MVRIKQPNWPQALGQFLRPFAAELGHQAQRKWCPVYVQGLLTQIERKSIRPLADVIAPGQHEQLHHFISKSGWSTQPLEDVLAFQAQRLVGNDGVLIVDDISLPKTGTHSVGVAHQYCGVLGKMANYQTLVSLTLARDGLPVPIALRLFLPSAWTDDPQRCQRADVPVERQLHRTKLTIALDEIDRLVDLGLRFKVVLADAGYGNGASFRQGLSARSLQWVVGIQPHQKVYPLDVQVPHVVRTHKRGRPQKHAVPDQAGRAVQVVLTDLPPQSWRTVVWRPGSKGPLQARFVVRRVRVGDGEKTRGGIYLPGEEVWLIGEWRTNGEKRFYLSNLPKNTSNRQLIKVTKQRFWCELGHQQLKGELGLDHFEGRSWQGLHHHALLCMVALAFVQEIRRKKSYAFMTVPQVVRAMGGSFGTVMNTGCPCCGWEPHARGSPQMYNGIA